MKKVLNILIIGAGVAGIGCARQLTKMGIEDFTIVSEDIGGRISTSEDGLVNYGAYFVCGYYDNVFNFVKKTRRLNIFRFDFHGLKGSEYSVWGILWYPVQLVRLFILMFRFSREYSKFRTMNEHLSQKELIESSPLLNRAYHTKAIDFIKEECVEDISKKYLDAAVYMCSFLPLSKVSGFDFLRVCLGVFVPAHEFIFLKDKFIKGLEDKIVIDTVEKIERDCPYKVTTKQGKVFYAQNVVVATPIHVSKKLLGLHEIRDPAIAYMYHIRGKLKEGWSGAQFEVFTGHHHVIALAEQLDGTVLFYDKIDDIDLGNYFEDGYEIIIKKKWSPAFTLI